MTIFREEATSALVGLSCGSSILVELEFEDSKVFLQGGGGGDRRTQRKTVGARREPPTTNSTHIWHRAGIEPRPHWWEANPPTTAPSLLKEKLKRYASVVLKETPKSNQDLLHSNIRFYIERMSFLTHCM